MTNWYSGDWHLGLLRVIENCNRPFASTAEMDQALIDACSCIDANDDFWFLGDFSFGKNRDASTLRAWFDAIPGRKHLIVGNHDNDVVRTLPWATQHELVQIEDDQQEVALCHYPMLSFPGSGRGAIQLFGHVHDLWAGSRNSINVGVDQWGFRPVTLPEILERAVRLPLNAHYHDVEFVGASGASLPPKKAKG
ncbi:metallophosphoesterase [Shimia sp. R9_3]|uniref:metallophosphoesterase n=1 Tax=Shimia sp. R9_3 TaxID=2821113 RepID=UPI001ADBF84A|nr:metallophosphoesterase [Shimia sp. R9_3]MBO9403043.1 metallophosphoesterase [Shimia sp. R9_3]